MIYLLTPTTEQGSVFACLYVNYVLDCGEHTHFIAAI